MKFPGPDPKSESTQPRTFGSVRAGGPLSVGDFAAEALAGFSPFDVDLCLRCGYAELYRKTG